MYMLLCQTLTSQTMKKLYELPFQVVNKYDPLNDRKYYKYIEQEYYKPSGTIKLTLLSEDHSDRIEITSDFKPSQHRDKKFIAQKSDLSDDLKKQLDFLLFVFYRSIFITKSGKSYTCCTFETNALKEIKEIKCAKKHIK